MYEVSFYKNISDTKSKEIIKITDFFNAIQNGKYKKKIDSLKSLSAKKEISEAKKELPNITASGIFKTRIDNDLVNHSGLVQIDFDNDSNPDCNPISCKAALIKDQYTFAAFISPTGTGLKLLVKIKPEEHKEVYNQLEIFYKEKYKLQLDTTCRNISRAMFVSFDPELFHNTDSKIFALDSYSKKAEPKATESLKLNNKVKEVELLIEKIEALKTDITGDYRQWLKVGFALASEFGLPGEEYFQKISKFGSGYDRNVCKKQYAECCKGRKSGVSISTLFSVAKEYNIYVHDPVKKNTAKSQSVKTEKKKNDSSAAEIVFYNPIYKADEDGNQAVKDLKINYVKFVELIYSFGFRRFDIDREFIYIQLKDTVIKEVTVLQIQDYFFSYLEKLPDELSNGVTKKSLKEKIYNNPKNYFCDNRLSLLINKKEIIFNSDTKTECFIYFQNGYVRCNPEGWELKPYSSLTGHIWLSQIIKRDFIYRDINNLDISKLSVYAQFMYNVSGRDNKRFGSLCSLVGYLLHSYTDVKMKSVILTDSRISEEANGRTGKTLFGQTLKHIKKLTQINGKDFDPTNRYKYQEASLDTQIIFLNDVRSNFRFEVLYNDITEGITVEKKNQTPFSLKIKMCITTNKTIAIEGSSSRDRSIEFEFSGYYNENYSPEDEFKQRFFSDWNVSEWQQFDNFMMYCISVYLDKGVVEPENINLAKRKLLDQTHSSFLDFMNDKILTGEIQAGKEIIKSELHTKFLEENPDFKDDKYRKRAETFTKWLKLFAKYAGVFGENFEEGHSGPKKWFIYSHKK